MSKTLECSHATGAHDEACDLVVGLTEELRKVYDELAWARMDLDYKIQEHECLLSIQKDREFRRVLSWEARRPQFEKEQALRYQITKMHLADCDEVHVLRKQVAELQLQLSQKFCPHCGKKGTSHV